MKAPQSTEDGRDPPLLIVEDGVFPLTSARDETVAFSLTLLAGEFVMLIAEDEAQEGAVTRTLYGLLPPLSGRVRFQGHDWRDLSPERASALRGRIGTVFGADSWSPYATILDSMILAQLHHTRRSLESICQDASRWSLRFGLPGLPKGVPSSVSLLDRQSAAFARGFLGSPALIVIRHQPRALPQRLLCAVTTAIWEVRERGTAVIWLTRDETFERDRPIPASRQIRIGGPVGSAVEASA